MKHYKQKDIFFRIHLKWLFLIIFAQIFRKKILFWGASLFLKDFFYQYNIHTSTILGIIDNNTYKTSKPFCGYKIINPSEIDKQKPDYIVFAIKNNHKRVYQEVKLNLQLSDYKSKLLKDDFIELEQQYSKLNNIKAEKLNSFIQEVAPQKAVYIFQYGFYDKDGKNFYAGGAERYAIDLAKLIANLGYKPILIQAGNQDSKSCWINKINELIIIGLNAQGGNYFKIVSQLKEPQLVIYSGILEWDKNINYKNTLLISHGITWDTPRTNADLEFLHRIIKIFDNIISVDTNTISWFRSTFSNYLSNQNKNIQYVPNYVDLAKYKPIQQKKSSLKITYPRRCSDERGFWLFADIVPEIIRASKDIVIEFVGYIHTDIIKNKIDELVANYPNNIIHRLCKQDEMTNVYQNTNITVIPTLYSEGTSLSCLEAMACGNAVIATNVGGLTNLIINNFNGKLINPDKNSLYTAIIELIENKNLREHLSQNAIKVSQAFSKTVWNEEWTKILSKYLI